MTRILVSDAISSEGLNILKSGGFEVDYIPDITPEDLVKEIGKYDGLVIRSRTTVTAEVFEAAKNLKVVGRAGVGLDNVDVAAATKKGVIVMNTPGGNTISTAEHSFAMLTSLARNIPQANASMHEGKWDKKKYVGVELHNKVLGIIGMGRIGGEVARRAQAYGMQIMAYDPFISQEVVKRLGITQATVDEIAAKADFITVHSPLNDATRGIVGAKQFEMMKPGVRVINCARGGIIDEEALLEAVKSGKVAGAALDVFTQEPLATDSPFRGFDNVILTPHLGASTSEAQEGVAKEVAEQIVDALSGKTIRNAANAPSVDPAILEQIRPFINLAQRMGTFMAQFMNCAAKELKVYYSGTVLDYPVASITTAAVIGFLEPLTEGSVNFVNAPSIAKDRGIEVTEMKSTKIYDFANLITLEIIADDGTKAWIGGSLLSSNNARIVMLNDKFFDVVPDGNLIVIENHDVPGIIGSVGTILGHHKINIAQMTWGRTHPGADAITVINVDQDVPKAVLDEIAESDDIISARCIRI
ncbi:phosphoglycerate dehydrogenase [candidate division BRC1 bacterium HGW-BRC1-1]|jgi:D-3-phosphoglycerate dehydrogenase|nr:MAG: phosphoglycerate dehydrogenase [candidate division BRC1 bacterium HGW-BRC1-1]